MRVYMIISEFTIITFTLSSKGREVFLNGYSCARLGQKTMNSKASSEVSAATAMLKAEDVVMVDKATKHACMGVV